MNRRWLIAVMTALLLVVTALGIGAAIASDGSGWQVTRTETLPNGLTVRESVCVDPDLCQVDPDLEKYPQPDGVNWLLENVVDGERWITIDLDAPGVPKLSDIDPRDYGPNIRSVQAIHGNELRRELPDWPQTQVTPEGKTPPASLLGGGYGSQFWHEWYTPWRYERTLATNPDLVISELERSADNACNAPGPLHWSYSYTYRQTGTNRSTLTIPEVLELGYDVQHEASAQITNAVDIPPCWEVVSQTRSHYDWARFQTRRERLGCEIDPLWRCRSVPVVLWVEQSANNTAQEIWRIQDRVLWNPLNP